MNELLCEINEKILTITLNRVEKHNAFDDKLLANMTQRLREAEVDESIRVIVLKANGRHFSAGADLSWMKRMADFNEEENLKDSMVLGNLMYALHKSAKPTIAVVHGAAYGGGAGLVAACDIAIAAENARFCFSEVKLGLIPAVISPYVINAIGPRAAAWLFTTAEVFDAKKALELQLLQHCVPQEQLTEFSKNLAQNMASLAPDAVQASKKLIYAVHNQPIDQPLIEKTAALIAKKRVSEEAQVGMKAFLNKTTPVWD